MTFNVNLRSAQNRRAINDWAFDRWTPVSGVSPQDAALKFATSLSSTGSIEQGRPVVITVCGTTNCTFDNITVTPSGFTVGSLRTAKAAA
tara:strand:+ start:304 stop:573 length:270 start_codon:yes stop_codon:yes gene_type:complete